MEAPIPMENKAKNLPYGGMMPPLHHTQTLHGPPPGFQRTPPPPHDQPHGLPAPIPHTGPYEQHWRQPYHPSPYETAAQRRHSNPVTQPPPQSQPPPPGHPPPSHSHVPYPPPGPPPPPPPQQQQHPVQPPSRELPQPPLGDPYHRPNSLPAPAPSHPASEPHSPQSYRPMTGAQPEPTPHSAPPPSDYRPPRMAYAGPGEPSAPGVTNGEHAGPPPGYMQHVPPHHSQHPSGAIYDGAIVPYPRQRKAARAQQACDQCRARKAKCDEGRPACSHCRENNIECKYKDIPPQKQEKSTQLVLERVGQIEDNIVNVLMDRMTKMEKLLQYFITKSDIPLPAEASPDVPPEDLPRKLVKDIATTPNTPLESKPPTPAALELSGVDSKKKPEANLLSYINTVQHVQSQPLTNARDKEVDGELSVPQNHTTAAHKLLNWNSIQRLLDRQVHPDYVLRNESKRGLIRIYGCGEGLGHDTEYYSRHAPAQPRASQGLPGSAGSPITNTSTPRIDEEYSQANSPSWGYGLPMPLQSRLKEHPGGLDASGHLNTHSDVVRRLFHSYMSNMHILHPFMDATMLAQKVEVFILQYAPLRKNMGHSANEGRGMKRKRSTEQTHTHMVAPEMSPSPSLSSEKWPSHRIEHSIDNAIILMVLALGAICEHKTALPGFAPDPNERSRPKQEFASSPEVQAVLNEILSPTPASGLNTQAFDTPNFPSPDPAWGDWKTPNQRPHSRYGLENNNEAPYPKNIDVIPAHPFQSHGWICQAARACSFLIRSMDYENINSDVTFPFKELCEFAYWTCLQHESDLLAELDLTASGVSQSETAVQLPKGYLTLTEAEKLKDPESLVMFYYSAQIHLRKVLNRVHRDLYDTDVKALPDKILTVLGLNLDVWKSSLPKQMQWNEGDEPSSDINTARLRAKYYGARYIIYRPVLERALHSMSPRAEGNGKAENDSKLPVSSFKAHDFQAPSMARWSSEPGLRQNLRDKDDTVETIHYDELDDETRRACEQCITAAIQSTKAFHNIKGRPIVTNIFGTAHAQFGNMLVLSATYMSNLNRLVDADELERLLQRTIKFLAMYKDISPTLMADAQILSGIYYKIFKKPLNTSFTTESFGST
uniref:Sterol regulatory element-binding protein ECM22 n=1 Tax=Talaromyces marneffei PM1 TaxID=1077442 RepID=A0A093V4I9_TALMA